MSTDLDTLDLKILALLQRDASLTTRELAERAGVSLSPCWRHIQHLRDEGYIRSSIAVVDRHKLGFLVLVFAQVKIGRLTQAAHENLVKEIVRTPEILECYTILGETGLMLKVVAPSVDAYEKVLLSRIACLPGVQDVRSTVTLLDIKSTTAVPLNERRLR